MGQSHRQKQNLQSFTPKKTAGTLADDEKRFHWPRASDSLKIVGVQKRVTPQIWRSQEHFAVGFSSQKIYFKVLLSRSYAPGWTVKDNPHQFPPNPAHARRKRKWVLRFQWMRIKTESGLGSFMCAGFIKSTIDLNVELRVSWILGILTCRNSGCEITVIKLKKG
jgi:hypothetical protein